MNLKKKVYILWIFLQVNTQRVSNIRVEKNPAGLPTTHWCNSSVAGTWGGFWCLLVQGTFWSKVVTSPRNSTELFLEHYWAIFRTDGSENRCQFFFRGLLWDDVAEESTSGSAYFRTTRSRNLLFCLLSEREWEQATLFYYFPKKQYWTILGTLLSYFSNGWFRESLSVFFQGATLGRRGRGINLRFGLLSDDSFEESTILSTFRTRMGPRQHYSEKMSTFRQRRHFV